MRMAVATYPVLTIPLLIAAALSNGMTVWEAVELDPVAVTRELDCEGVKGEEACGIGAIEDGRGRGVPARTLIRILFLFLNGWFFCWFSLSGLH